MTLNPYEYFKNLNDYLETEEIERMFIDVISNASEYSKSDLIEILYELAIRHGNNYKLLEEKTRGKLDELVCTLWGTDSLREVQSFTAIILIMGLVKSFERIKNSLKDSVTDEIREEILQTIEEAGDHIENPLYEYEEIDGVLHLKKEYTSPKE